jgi:hypothetical protein
MTATDTKRRRKQSTLERLHALAEKYERLVWYARSHPAGDPFWDTVPAEIKQGALNCQAMVQEQFPDELDLLCCHDCGDWHHGFNSGMLAASRLLLAYLHPQDDPSEWDQQIEDAEAEFPELFT